MRATIPGACNDAVGRTAAALGARSDDGGTPDEADFSAIIDGTEYRYALDASGNARLVSCTTDATALDVPARIDGHAVVALADEAFATRRPNAAPGITGSPNAAAPKLAGAFYDKHSTGRNGQLERVILPEGVTSIGRGAFRGCKALREIALPESLREIADFAFSLTAIASLRIPAACTELEPRALWMGPEALPGVQTEYQSPLQDIQVAAGNPAFRVLGGLLCRTRGDEVQTREAHGTWEVALAPGQAACATVPDHTEIGADAFSGVERIGTLSVPDGTRLHCTAGLLPGGLCDCLELRFRDLPEPVALAFPDGTFARTVLDATRGMERLDGAAVVHAYDCALDAAQQGFDPARLMAVRLAAPALLDEQLAASFRAKLERALESLCAHFGARAQWEGFDLLADAGLLGEAEIERVIGALGALDDGPAVSHLLSLKRRRYGKATWAYEL